MDIAFYAAAALAYLKAAIAAYADTPTADAVALEDILSTSTHIDIVLAARPLAYFMATNTTAEVACSEALQTERDNLECSFVSAQNLAASGNSFNPAG